MKEKNFKAKVLTRSLETGEFSLRKENGETILSFSASSEKPIERWFGKEILSHEPGAVRMKRIDAGAVPFLFNHDEADPRGMITKGKVEGRKLRVEAKLFDTEEAKKLGRQIEGGFRNISLRYRIYEVTENRSTETFTATDWEPLEISSVSVPADESVGMGRSDGEENEVKVTEEVAPTGARSLEMKKTPEQIAADEAAARQQAGAQPGQQPPVPGEGTRSIEVTDPPPVRTAVDAEKDRKRGIANLCKANSLGDTYRDMWTSQGLSLAEVSDQILLVLEERGKSNPQPATLLGLSARETKQFSLSRAIMGVASNRWEGAEHELECCQAVAKKLGRAMEPNRIILPFDVLRRPPEEGKRQQLDITSGANLIDTANMGFIELLRHRTVLLRMGARRLSGLQGNVNVPRQSAAGTAYWLTTDTTAVTESEQAFTQLALTPHTVAAYTELTRQLMLQSSPAADSIVSDDLAQVVARAVDLAGLVGAGASGEPKGLTQTTGVGSLNDGVGDDYASMLEAQSIVAEADVMPLSGGYITTPFMAAKLMQAARFANSDTPVWVGNIWDGIVAGFRAMSSNQPPAASLFFGDWQEMVIAEWGTLELEINPFANFKAGIIGVRAMYSVDIGVRRPFAFVAVTDITGGS